MLAYIRRYQKSISLFLLFNMISMLGVPNRALALTSGPSQPETQQFAPAGMDNMVDPFTGDFSYNIPLLDVGGYPININYASGINPDAEASWTGLGWNLNVGAINRSVRGVPDDFAGDAITKEFNIKPNQTFGVSANINLEIYGLKIKTSKFKIGLSSNFFYNTYNGFGMSVGVSPSVSAGLSSKSSFTGSMGLSATLGSESGLEVSPTLGLKAKQEQGDDATTIGTSIGFPFSTREGLKGMSMSSSYSTTTNSKYAVTKDGKESTVEYKGESQGGGGTGAFMGFASPTYTPSLQHDMYNVNASLNLTFSPTDPASEMPVFGFGGYYSGQFLKGTSRSTPAYGYMYSGLSQSEDKILDFNREKDGGFNKFTTNLAVTNFTYDVFQVSGQGVGGTYRLHRGDVGAVHDPITTDQGYSPSLGIEIGVGTPPSAKVGVDAQFNYTQGFSGRWADNNSNIKHFNSENNTSLNSPGREPVYFKRMGELAPETDVSFLENVQVKYSPVRHSVGWGQGGYLNGRYDVIRKNETTLLDEHIQHTINPQNLRTVRQPRATAFTTLNANEAATAAILPIQNYSMNNFTWLYKNDNSRSADMSNVDRGYEKAEISRKANGRKGPHISETRVTDGSGTRYIYGIPAYNTVQEEVTFAKPGNLTNAQTGIINYEPGIDDVSGNKNGLDHYFNKVSTPAFAHSYLLTCILSSDYVDRDNVPGPSDGDLGSYTKFNYTRAIETFKWRTPFSAQTGVASFSEGMYGTNEDDKGNYIYGEKEVWYLHSIETRTHVAEFYLKDREDGRGVAGRDGGIGSPKLKFLEKILLYSKPDKWNSKAEPVKVVHFDYDYSLCPNTPNSLADGGGKLTLKKIWFTYGNSEKGILNPYVFNYARQNFNGAISQQVNPAMETALNPGYDFKNYDRWGNFKADNTDGLRNAEFPYAVQNKTTADQNAAVWSLSSIRTPTGGTMRVYYESDDYAYVQKKQAMRMFKVLGAVNSETETPGNDLYDKNYLMVDLGENFIPENPLTRDAEFREKYLADIDLMYYKVLLKVINEGGINDRDEIVPGYAEIDKNLSKPVADLNGNYTRAIINLKFVGARKGKTDAGSLQVNPIVRNGWMFGRLYLNRELMGSANAQDSGLEQILRSMLSQIKSIAQLMTGFSLAMLAQSNSRYFDASHSFVRLNEPDKIKLGGGHRVKALVMVDNWDLMRSQSEKSEGLTDKQLSFYGQTYDYTYMENGRRISAGVAAYEPMMGGEENPHRLPVFVREKVPMAPAKEYFLEEPFGESFFPAPTVGYRKVVVTPIKVTGTDLDLNALVGNGTGRVENEFYTAYDFPTITKRTSIKMERHKPNILFKFLKLDSRDLVTCTQGYSIELNDMHGKQKATRVYPEHTMDANGLARLAENKPISEVEYRYKQNADGTLNNKVSYIKPDLTLASGNDAVELGVNVDMVQDERYHETTTLGGGIQFNLKWVQVAVVPIIVPTFFPDFTSEQTRFRSVVSTKVVNRYGIVESTTAKDNGASITTNNLAWDAKTGHVLLTEVQNEFHDPLYSFTMPGHWAYPQMDVASLNEGVTFNSGGLTAVAPVLKDGDEVVCQLGTGGILAYYVPGAGGTPRLIDKNGQAVTASYSKAKVIRSGARNTASAPVGSIATLDNPIRTGSNILAFSRVLNAGVSEYKDDWKRFCNCSNLENENQTSNPYVLGTRGNLRPLRSWTYLTERTQGLVNNNPNIRRDGHMADFSMFWQYDLITKYMKPPVDPSETKWQFVTEIQNYNPVGMEIENKDALERYSMAQFGYGRNLPVATSNNSKYQETGFDGFEDYGFGDCEDDHFSWRAFQNRVTNEEAHTGRNSIKVEKNTNVSISKVIIQCEE